MLQLEIFTPKRAVLQVSCDRVQLPGVQGKMTVLPGHSTLLAQLGAGIICVHGKRQNPNISIAAGFAWVQGNCVRVLCDEPSPS
ncbi:MAG: F0F1 ATP synthase subunit epsilon [Myxococcota bacterium]